MAVDLATKYLGLIDELFVAESRSALVTNTEFDWDGAAAVKIYKLTSVPMTDYNRAGTGSSPSRYGELQPISATTQTLTLNRDRSFTYAIDALDEDETVNALAAASTLARQMREVVIPEVDTWTYSKMCAGAGTKPGAIALTEENIYSEILKAGNVLDNAEIPESGRVLLLTPDVYVLLKRSKDVVLETDIGADMRLRGVISNLDGANVIRVPANRLPNKFGFMLAHPAATVAPVKLADFRTHENPPGISGNLVEGRIAYDAFVLENKAKAIYYQVKS